MKYTLEKIEIHKKENIKNFTSFMDYAAHPDDPLSVVIKSHNYLDQLASEIIKLHMKEPEKLLGDDNQPKNYYLRQKVNLLSALGYINDENVLNNFEALDKLRNKFAHRYSYKIVRSDIEKFGVLNNNIHLVDNLLSYIANLVGYFMSIRTMLEVAPFYNECCNRQDIFIKDSGFKSREIKSNYPENFNKLFMMTEKDWKTTTENKPSE